MSALPPKFLLLLEDCASRLRTKFEHAVRARTYTDDRGSACAIVEVGGPINYPGDTYDPLAYIAAPVDARGYAYVVTRPVKVNADEWRPGWARAASRHTFDKEAIQAARVAAIHAWPSVVNKRNRLIREGGVVRQKAAAKDTAGNFYLDHEADPPDSFDPYVLDPLPGSAVPAAPVTAAEGPALAVEETALPAPALPAAPSAPQTFTGPEAVRSTVIRAAIIAGHEIVRTTGKAPDPVILFNLACHSFSAVELMRPGITAAPWRGIEVERILVGMLVGAWSVAS